MFEIVTAASFEAFREARVDYAVIEVGLGGRLVGGEQILELPLGGVQLLGRVDDVDRRVLAPNGPPLDLDPFGRIV